MQPTRIFVLTLALFAMACRPEAHADVSVADSSQVQTTEAPTAPVEEQDPREQEAAPYDDDKAARSGMPIGVTETYYACLKRGNYATLDKVQCVSEEVDRQDRRLNEVYRKLLDLLPDEKRQLVVEAQRAWLDLRVKDEYLEAQLYGGEQVENAQVALNDMVRIAQRADLLDKYLGAAEISGR